MRVREVDGYVTPGRVALMWRSPADAEKTPSWWKNNLAAVVIAVLAALGAIYYAGWIRSDVNHLQDTVKELTQDVQVNREAVQANHVELLRELAEIKGHLCTKE